MASEKRPLVYLASGRNAKGKTASVRVRAASAMGVVETLEAEGFTDIVLHTDDAMAEAAGEVQDSSEESILPDDPHLSAKHEIRMQTQSRLGYFVFMLRKFFWTARWQWAFVAALLAFDWGWDHYIGPVSILILLGFVTFLVGLAVHSTWFSMAASVDRFTHDLSWGQWQKVIERVPKFRGTIPDFELDRRLACALAGLGRIDEALALVEPYSESEMVSEWRYWTCLAEVYASAQRRTDVLKCLESAYACAPDQPVVKFAYAKVLLVLQESYDFADRLIAEAEAQAITHAAQKMVLHLKGVAALNRGHHEAAAELLAEAEEGLTPYARGLAVYHALLDATRAYRAIALAKVGRMDEARHLFRKAQPRLEALKEVRVLNRWAEASGA